MSNRTILAIFMFILLFATFVFGSLAALGYGEGGIVILAAASGWGTFFSALALFTKEQK